jgi:hypothetical protein
VLDALWKTALSAAVALAAFQAPGRSPAPSPGGERRAVVVELFSSEGCSTCPPADALLRDLEERQPIPGVQIVPLEEHVDYWNQGGWTDPFSSRDWTARQMAYAAVGPTGQAFTPEMVVDGRAQFVGSKEAEADREIASEARKPGVEVSLAPEGADGEGVRLSVTVGGLPELPKDSADVFVAVTEDGLESHVLRGENAGRTVQHGAVVRALHKIGGADPKRTPAFSSSYRLKLGSGWNAARLRIVAFVQEAKSRAILGAASLPRSAFP